MSKRSWLRRLVGQSGVIQAGVTFSLASSDCVSRSHNPQGFPEGLKNGSWCEACQ